MRRNPVILAVMLGIEPEEEVDFDRNGGMGPSECELFVKGPGKQRSLRCLMTSISLVPTPT